MDTSGKACIEFFTKVKKNGDLNGNTATALQVACTQVLSNAVENWETADMATLDRDVVFTRFVHLRHNDFTSDSLQTYKSRFFRGLDTFLIYAKDPAAWKPKTPSPRREKVAANGPPRAAIVTAAVEVPAPPTTTAGRTGLLDYSFPLSREGRLAVLRLPPDLTANDVKRLTAFLNTLVLDDGA